MAEYLLYGFEHSGIACKPALYLELAGAHRTPRLVDFCNGDTRTPEYRRIDIEWDQYPRCKHPFDLLPGLPVSKRA